jgi:glycosyltransferase involved in cell wall biosynthesis
VRVWIVGDNFGFPNGAGATARVHGFAAALRSAGAELRIFCATPTELAGRRILNRDAAGTHAGVAFEYACGTTTLPSGLLERRRLRVRSAARLRAVARKARRRGEAPDVVIATAQTISGLVLAIATARWAGARCVLDACELPSGFVREGPRRALHRLVYAQLARRLDGLLCISTVLERHWAARVRLPTLRVPILADVSNAPTRAGDGSRRVLYAGSLAHADEVTALLEAFAEVARDDAAARLEILGDDPGTDAVERLRAKAAQLGAGAQVDFLGAVERAAAADAIGRAAVLALPRPRTPWSEAGLSAKLVDYLATERPVVVTGIGDIPLYLEHGVSAFVVAPGDRGAFAAALRDALADPARADTIGRRGREVALREFDVRVHGPRLAAFFESLA